jgi:hypothetical protein
VHTRISIPNVEILAVSVGVGMGYADLLHVEGCQTAIDAVVSFFDVELGRGSQAMVADLQNGTSYGLWLGKSDKVIIDALQAVRFAIKYSIFKKPHGWSF